MVARLQFIANLTRPIIFAAPPNDIKEINKGLIVSPVGEAGLSQLSRTVPSHVHHTDLLCIYASKSHPCTKRASCIWPSALSRKCS